MRRKFSKSSALSPGHSRISSLSSAVPHDLIVKLFLKHCNELEHQLNRFNSKKFNSHKGSGVLKSNLLRTSLLPFLRNPNILALYLDPQSSVFQSLLNVVLTVLLKWWALLLANLKHKLAAVPSPCPPSVQTLKVKKLVKAKLVADFAVNGDDILGEANLNCSLIPQSDRNAYLECISRIVSRSDWQYADATFRKRYLALLTCTLDSCIDQMTNLKTYSVATAAFAGKIFAYSVFSLPGVANALLFLLNVRQGPFEKAMAALEPQRDPMYADLVHDAFPAHLHSLINYSGLTSVFCAKQKASINCLPTPHHPVPGIKDPNAGWVSRWCNCDSNVFNSFYKHYIDICARTVAKIPGSPAKRAALIANCPGYTVIYAHVFEIILSSMSRINLGPSQKNTGSPPLGAVRDKSGLSFASAPINTSFSPSLQTPSLQTFSDKRFTFYYSSIIKHFRTLRYIVYNTSRFADASFVGETLIVSMDSALKSLARETSIHDHQRNGLVLSIVSEFFNFLNDTSLRAMHCIDWAFWLSCIYSMVSHTDHVQVLLRSFSFLFNNWVHIADDTCATPNASPLLAWITNPNNTVKNNFASWLTGQDLLLRFMSHWNPSVRSYYMRFVVWHIIGANNSVSVLLVETTLSIQTKLDSMHKSLSRNRRKLCTIGLDRNMDADCPFVSRRIAIVPMSQQSDGGLYGEGSFSPTSPTKTNYLRKTNPYEIFDEAVYTCSAALVLPLGDGVILLADDFDDEDDVAMPKLLVSTLGKLFRYWAPSDDKYAFSDTASLKSTFSDTASLKSTFSEVSSISSKISRLISALSFDRRSRSSTPSLSSFGSYPTSASYSTTASSLYSDSFNVDPETLALNQPATDCAQNPPEVVRPSYVFDVTLDHESIHEKHRLINSKNRDIICRQQDHQPSFVSVLALQTTQELPPRVRIPLMTFTGGDGHYLRLQIADSEPADFDGMSLTAPKLFDKSLVKNVGLPLKETEDARTLAQLVLVGRGLNEFDRMLHEFVNYIHCRIELDLLTTQNNLEHTEPFKYLRSIYPYLAVDGYTDLRLLNAC